MTQTILQTYNSKKQELETLSQTILEQLESILDDDHISEHSITFASEEFLQIIIIVSDYLPSSLLDSINNYLGDEPNMYFNKREVELRYMYQ